MNIKKLLINTLMIGAVAMAPMTMSSCSDDDGGNGGGNGGGSGISKNSARVILSGGASDTIESSGKPQLIDSTGTGTGQLDTPYSGKSIAWANGAGNSVTVSFAKQGTTGAGTGTFSPFTFGSIIGGQLPSQYSYIIVRYNGKQWTPADTTGNVEVTTNAKNKAVGTINNLTLSNSSPTDSTKVTVNGAFNVQN